MKVRFKPKFAKDVGALNSDKQLMTALKQVISQVQEASGPNRIGNIKQLIEYATRHTIRLTLDRKRDYRIGLYIKGDTVWFARLLHRRNIYRKNW